MTARVGVIAVVVGLGVFACARPPATRARVVGLDTRIETLPDGSLRVREAFALEPDGAEPIEFHRRIERPRTDGLLFESAEVDGRVTKPGHEGLEVRTAAPHALDVAWIGSGIPGSATPRRLTLTYKALSAVAVTEPRAAILWPILDAGRGFDVGRVAVELVLPPGTPVYAGTGMIEAGWQVALAGAGLTASRGPVMDVDTATLAAAFDFDRRGVSDPVWERNLDRQRQFLPALLAGAAFFVVIGIGTIVIVRAQYPPTSKPRSPAAGEPPSDADRAAAARGLVLAGMAGSAMALLTAAASAWGLAFLGPWPQLIPASMLAVSLAFIAYAPRLRT